MNPSRPILNATVVAGVLALGAKAPAQNQVYTQKTRLINAAVVVLDADKSGINVYGQTAAPYAFYNLDRATDVKPGGWTFINPFAPGVTTAEIAARYGELGDTANGPPDPTLAGNAAQTITKRNAPYWTVSLSQLSDQQISTYNVLLIAPRNNFSLNSFEREKLRRFVDGGGVLWVDTYAAGAFDSRNNLPYAIQPTTIGGTTLFSDSSSPLLNAVRQVTGGDLNWLTSFGSGALKSVTSGQANDTSLIWEFARYQGAVWMGTPGSNLPVVASARLGDGAIVVTARGAAELLNQGGASALTGNVNAANLSYRAADSKLGPAGRAAARLAINIVALSGSVGQPNGGPRKSSSSSSDPGAPVLTRQVAEGAYGPDGAFTSAVPVGSPVTYKGFLVAPIHDGSNGYRIAVFDADPSRDLDGDGDPDDGLGNTTNGAVVDAWRDSSVGKPMDVIWVSKTIPGPISAPVCVGVPESYLTDTTGPATDLILVTGGDGHVYGFSLAPRLNGRIVGGKDRAYLFDCAPPGGASPVLDPGVAPNPPTVYDNLAYVADATGRGTNAQGRVWVVNLARGTRMVTPGATPTDWYVGGPAASGNPLPYFTASPTVGYIPIQDGTGGQDRVLYGPGYSGPNLQPTLVSLWLGAKGEKPTVEYTGGVVKLTTRAGLRGSLPFYDPAAPDRTTGQMRFHISITDQFGNPQDVSQWATTAPTISAPGVVTFNTGKDQATIDSASIRIDYTIDWGSNPSQLSAAIARGRLLLPIVKSPSADTGQRILGPIALTPRGTMHLIEGNPSGAAGGTYWALREDAGQGSFRVVSRYTLTKKYTQSFGTVGGYAVPASVEDVDGVQSFIPSGVQGSNFNNFINLRYAGGVSVRGGVAYAAFNADRPAQGFNLPVTGIMAFRAEPETPELRIGASLGTNPQIVQADMQRSDPNAIVRAPTSSTLAGDKLSVDAVHGVIRLESLASSYRDEITDSISLSQPIGIRSDGRTVEYRVPDAMGDRWSPLLWFSLWNGGTAVNAPLVAGNEVFLAANSFLPDLLANGTLNSSAVVWSVDADAPTTGNYAKTLANRPWLVQQIQLIVNSPTSVDPSPYFRMPQNRGATLPQNWIARLLQTKMGTSAYAGGVAGGDGAVVAWGGNASNVQNATTGGLYSMSRADFVVCDEGRLLRVDSSGNPVSNTFGTRFSGIGNGGGTAEMRPLVRPVKAHAVGTSDFLVVDAGANRVVRLDEDGTALRTVERIALDPTYKPAAYRVNDPLTLKDPQDATTFSEYVTKGANEIVTGQRPLEYWVHTLVADSGNGRIVDLIDRFEADASTYRIQNPVTIPAPDPETGRVVDTAQVGVLWWQSPSIDGAAHVGNYYTSLNRVYVGSFATGRYVYVASVSRSRPTRASAGLDNPDAGLARPASSSGGAIVMFDPLGGMRVFDRFNLQSLAATPFLANPTTGVFNVNTRASSPAEIDRPFSGLMSVTAQPVADSSGASFLRLMATDADAVYEFDLSATTLADPVATLTLTPRWFVNEAAFTALRPGAAYGKNAKYFRPTFARRLDSGDVLVVNGYRGLTRDGIDAYSGEVTLLEGQTSFGLGKQNLGFTLGSVRFELPPLTGIRGLLSPVFADRR